MRRVLRAAALAVLIAGLWCAIYGRTSLESWDVPVGYVGDCWSTLAYLKAAQDGHVYPFGLIEVPELNAPYGANWNDYLRQHKLQFWLAGALARAVGLVVASNLLLLLAHVLAALSFYAVARYFRVRREWAFAGAVAFALAPFLFYRSLPHLMLSFVWPIPPAILAVTWAFGRHGLRVGSRRFWVGVAIVLAVGVHNIYYAGLLAQFLTLASLTRLVTKRGRGALAPLLLLAVLFTAVAADNANIVVYSWTHGPSLQAVSRPYGNLERFALKPIELLLPPGGFGLAPWRPLATTYYQSALFRGEMGSAYLGLVGIAALAWLAIVTSATYLRRPKGFPPAAFLALAWVLAYSVVGGLNGILGLLGFVWFRATNRYSIWILALVLLWAAVRLSRARWSRCRLRRASLLAAGLVMGLVVADRMPWPMPDEEILRIRRVVDSDRHFVRSLEAALPPGAMLFQLPVVAFPEGPRIRKASDYEHFRPYLFSSSLRFSYGSDKGRPRERWQRRVYDLPAEPLAFAAERLGFAGLLVNRKAYADGGQELRERLGATGRREAWESRDGTFLFIRLRPVSAPVSPGDLVLPAAPTDTGRS